MTDETLAEIREQALMTASGAGSLPAMAGERIVQLCDEIDRLKANGSGAMSPHLFRRWLIQQGDRLFAFEWGGDTPWGLYMADACGPQWRDRYPVREWPAWTWRLIGALMQVFATGASVPAPEIVLLLDAAAGA